jgi:hypothetical protein
MHFLVCCFFVIRVIHPCGGVFNLLSQVLTRDGDAKTNSEQITDFGL